MKVSEYIIKFLISKNVTDIFGIPGGVVLSLLYSAEKYSNKLKAHLCYHEQGAAFAANGYAQVSGKLGVAYATRGPGFTNLITGIADAYYDSIPTLFITAHANGFNKDMRAEYNQEMDTISIVKNITKYAYKIENLEDVKNAIETAYKIAFEGRKGPVFLDFSSKILETEIGEFTDHNYSPLTSSNIDKVISEIENNIKKSKRPVFLIGDGIRQSKTNQYFKTIIDKNNIPVISSRFSIDTLGGSKKYFGYIGSHGIRYANFILSKADLIISLGNRMSFPIKSESFSPIIKKTKIIRVDVDKTEFIRNIENSLNFNVNLNVLLPKLIESDLKYENDEQWIFICEKLKEELNDCDTNETIKKISNILTKLPSSTIITSDVGNNEFWLSSAYIKSNISNRIIFSKSFGALGCSLPKAIGVQFATKQNVICFLGDQGLQLNVQELELISLNKLPIKIILLNNHSSGMIKDRETEKYESKYIHTTRDSGYGVPNIQKIAEAYGINYYQIDAKKIESIEKYETPCIIELIVDEATSLSPNLKKTDHIQKLSPYIDEKIYDKLNKL